MCVNLQCMQYALNRIPSLNEFCVICDERHVLETGLIKVSGSVLIHVSSYILIVSLFVLVAMCVYQGAVCVCIPNPRCHE